MIMKSQDGEDIYNLRLCYRVYCDKERIYAQFEVGQRFNDYFLGSYENSKRAAKILDEIFNSMTNGEKFFVMPET